MLYRSQNEYQNQMAQQLDFLESANQVAKKINNTFSNINAHADAGVKGRVVIFANDYRKRVTVPFNYLDAGYETGFKEKLQECLDVMNGKRYETNRIQKVLK